jgi:type I restriction enzyme, R subunit
VAEKPEKRTCTESARLLAVAGWAVHPFAETNINVSQRVVLRKFQFMESHGDADCMLYVDGRATGAIEVKKQAHTLTGVEIQSDKYVKLKVLPDARCIASVFEGRQ